MWQSFRTLLQTYGRSAPWAKRATAAAALQACRTYLDAHLPSSLAQQVYPLYLRGNVLTVAATHPAIAQRVQQEAGALVQSLREGGFFVTRLDVCVRGEPPTAQ